MTIAGSSAPPTRATAVAPQTTPSAPRLHLHNYATRQLRNRPVRLQPVHAADLIEQFKETCRVRKWRLLCAAVLSNHVHLVVGVGGDPDGADVLGDFKRNSGRRLNDRYGKPQNGSWWAESGSRRVIKREADLMAAVRYVATQEGAYLTWSDGSVREWSLPPDDQKHRPVDTGRSPEAPAG